MTQNDSPPAAERLVTFRWAGPFSYRDILQGKAQTPCDDEGDIGSLWNESTAYGIYQVYGTHPIYGSDALLYVGKAEQQTFAKRLRQEGWIENRDADRVTVYVGRLIGAAPPDAVWSQTIHDAERLLIFSVAPAGNSSAVNSTKVFEPHLRVFHVGNFRDIPAEVSSRRWDHADATGPLAAWVDGGKAPQTRPLASTSTPQGAGNGSKDSDGILQELRWHHRCRRSGPLQRYGALAKAQTAGGGVATHPDSRRRCRGASADARERLHRCRVQDLHPIEVWKRPERGGPAHWEDSPTGRS